MASPESKLSTEGSLCEDIRTLVEYCDRHHKLNYRQSYTIGILAILSSAAVVVAGLYDQSRVSAIFGLITGVLLAFERFDPSADKSQFYRELKSQGERLARDIRDNTRSAKQIRAEFDILHEYLSKSIPRQGLGEALKELNVGLSRATAQP